MGGAEGEEFGAARVGRGKRGGRHLPAAKARLSRYECFPDMDAVRGSNPRAPKPWPSRKLKLRPRAADDVSWQSRTYQGVAKVASTSHRIDRMASARLLRMKTEKRPGCTLAPRQPQWEA